MIATGSWRAALVAVDDAQKRADRPCPGRRTARSSSACRLPRLPRRQAPIFRNANPTPLRCLWLHDRRGLRRKHRDATSASPPQARHRAPVGCARRNLGLVVFGPGAHSQCENIDLKLTPGPNSAGRIMGEVNALQPYGQTPLTSAVSVAADALDFRHRPAVIVLLTAAIRARSASSSRRWAPA